MRFDDAAARLASLPARLPPPPASLMPVRVGETAARRWPGSPSGGRPAAVLVLIVPDDAGVDSYSLLPALLGGQGMGKSATMLRATGSIAAINNRVNASMCLCCRTCAGTVALVLSLAMSVKIA